MDLRDENQLDEVATAIKKSYTLIREAVKNNETTGWFAALEEDSDVESIDSDDKS